MSLTRRDFNRVAAATLGSGSASLRAEGPESSNDDLRGMIGVTTGTFGRHLSINAEAGKLRLLDLPVLMRDELDMKVLDLMSANIPSTEHHYLSQLRDRAVQAGCTITNLKMNQKGIDMGSPDPEIRREAVENYKSTIDAAAILGCRWVRPLPTSTAPDFDAYVQSYREMIDYAAEKNITLLIENFGWIQDDPDAIPRVLETVGEGLDVSVDTGNWSDRARYEGLEKAFPRAVTCDFKAKTLGPPDENGIAAHHAYDLRRCFQIGWDAGYRGPWFFEHVDKSLTKLLRELKLLRDMIRTWTDQQK